MGSGDDSTVKPKKKKKEKEKKNEKKKKQNPDGYGDDSSSSRISSDLSSSSSDGSEISTDLDDSIDPFSGSSYFRLSNYSTLKMPNFAVTEATFKTWVRNFNTKSSTTGAHLLISKGVCILKPSRKMKQTLKVLQSQKRYK